MARKWEYYVHIYTQDDKLEQIVGVIGASTRDLEIKVAEKRGMKVFWTKGDAR